MFVPMLCGAALQVVAFVYVSYSEPSVLDQAQHKGSNFGVADLEDGTQPYAFSLGGVGWGHFFPLPSSFKGLLTPGPLRTSQPTFPHAGQHPLSPHHQSPM